MAKIDCTPEYLEKKVQATVKRGFPPTKYQIFCWALLKAGFVVKLVEAQSTNSKYVYVYEGEKVFKVRFSDHKPRKDVQEAGDSDFYVGKSNGVVTNSRMALCAVGKFFGRTVEVPATL